jgi:hypothetical protein
MARTPRACAFCGQTFLPPSNHGQRCCSTRCAGFRTAARNRAKRQAQQAQAQGTEAKRTYAYDTFKDFCLMVGVQPMPEQLWRALAG